MTAILSCKRVSFAMHTWVVKYYPQVWSTAGKQYRGENKGLFVLLSRTQAGPGRTVKQEQEEISRNHVQTFIFPSVEPQAYARHVMSIFWYLPLILPRIFSCSCAKSRDLATSTRRSVDLRANPFRAVGFGFRQEKEI